MRQMITKMMNSARCGLKKENARGLHIEAALEAQHAVHPFSADEIEAKEIMQALAKMQRFEQLKNFSVVELKEFYKDEGINKIGENYVQKLGKKELVEGLVNHWGQVGVAEYIPLPSSVVPAAGIEKASNVAAYVQRVKSSGEKAEYGTFFLREDSICLKFSSKLDGGMRRFYVVCYPKHELKRLSPISKLFVTGRLL